ncbi:hypothetical protein Q8F55_007592 [Vanrija albida]|uniref:Uncharacterized protein n=1 Tax=Vanrija albida TaxID=181172 RepID=A0ABR3PTY4_9TREE
MIEAYFSVFILALVLGVALGTRTIRVSLLDPLVAWVAAPAGHFTLRPPPPKPTKAAADPAAPRMAVPGLTIPGDTVLRASAARAAFSAYAKVLVDELERLDVLDAVRRGAPLSATSSPRARSISSRSSSTSSRVRFQPSELEVSRAAAAAAARDRRRAELLGGVDDALGVYRGLLDLCSDEVEAADPDVVVSIRADGSSGEYRIDVRPASAPSTPVV